MKDKNKERAEEKSAREEKVAQEIDAAEHNLESMQEDLDRARAEAADYLDNLKRLKAEFENFRKRMVREQSEFLSLAAQEIIKALLPVVDSFERALTHEIAGDQMTEYKGGLQLVYGQLLDVLAKEGLEAIEPVGEQFDPNNHEAMMQVDSDEHSEGTVVGVLEKGYSLKGRVIRPAKVTVAG